MDSLSKSKVSFGESFSQRSVKQCTISNSLIFFLSSLDKYMFSMVGNHLLSDVDFDFVITIRGLHILIFDST